MLIFRLFEEKNINLRQWNDNNGRQPMLINDLSAEKRKFFLNLVQKRIKSGSGSSIEFLHKRTWIYPVTNLNLILKQAPFVIVEGVATRLYMPERMTLDLDILIKTQDRTLIYQDLTNANSNKIGNLSIAGSQWTLPDGTSLAEEKELTKIRQVIKTYLPTAEEDLASLIILGKLELEN